jgi:hypothetical protein
MTLAIAWRNPKPVRATKRYVKFGKDTLSDIYLVQELIGGSDEGQWASMSVLEVRGSADHVEAPRVPDHPSNGSRVAGVESHEPAAS